jgi:hypothetical protein
MIIALFDDPTTLTHPFAYTSAIFKVSGRIFAAGCCAS